MKRWFYLLLAATTFCASMGSASATTSVSVDKTGLKASQGFAFGLFQRVYAGTKDGNAALSPLSVQLALGMTANGAKNATRTGMLKAIGNSSLDRTNKTNQQLISLFEGTSQGADVRIGNALFVQNGATLQPSFTSANQKYYGAAVSTQDFHAPDAAATNINKWVKDRTQGLIEDFVDASAIKDSLMCLVNTVYFHGEWTAPFLAAQTQDAPFTTLAGKKVDVPMMQSAAIARSYYGAKNYQAVRLPYGDGRLAMSLFLPEKGEEAAFLKGFSVDVWLDYLSHAKSTMVELTVPKFTQEVKISLKTALSAMGMEQAFSAGKADFSGLAKLQSGKAYLSDVLHSTVIRVDEQGTEAAAATGAVVGITSLPTGVVTMNVDRPFAYVIEDTSTGAVLFIGSVGDPS